MFKDPFFIISSFKLKESLFGAFEKQAPGRARISWIYTPTIKSKKMTIMILNQFLELNVAIAIR